MNILWSKVSDKNKDVSYEKLQIALNLVKINFLDGIVLEEK